MTELGYEHDATDLIGTTFEPANDPSTVQRVTRLG